MQRGDKMLYNRAISSNGQEWTTASTGKSISVTLYNGCMLGKMLRKEIRAVKLVFLQRVKEVTTDGADAARQPTDI